MRTYFRLALYLCCVLSTTTVLAQAYKLNDDLVAGGNIIQAKVTPDGQYVVYRADKLQNGTPELFRVPISGGASVKLNIDITAAQSGGVDFFTFSPDSQYVVYAGNITRSSYMDVYSVPLLGGDTKRLNCNTADLFLIRGGPSLVSDLQVTPDSKHVLFLHDHVNFRQKRLYSAPIDQEAPPTLGDGVNQVLCGIEGTLELSPQPDSNQPRIRYTISPDSDHVVFTYGNKNANQSIFDVVYDVYSSDVDTSSTPSLVKLSTASHQGDRQIFSISPDSTRVVYSAETNQNGVFRLYGAPIAQANSPVQLGNLSNDDVFAFNFRVTDDSQRVVFTARDVPAGRFQLFSAPIDGGSNEVSLYPSNLFAFGATPSSSQVKFEVAPDSQRVAYTRDHDTAGVFELFVVNSTTGATQPQKRASLPSSNRNISSLRFTPDGRHLVFNSDRNLDNVTELFSVPANGGSLIRLSPDIEPTDDVSSAITTSDSNFAIYRLRSKSGLFASPITGGEAILINNELTPGGEILSFDVSPTGSHVVYLADQDTDGVLELYAFELPKINADDDLCVPVKIKTKGVAVICL